MKMEKVCSAPEVIDYYSPIGTAVLGACHL